MTQIKLAVPIYEGREQTLIFESCAPGVDSLRRSRTGGAGWCEGGTTTIFVPSP